MTVLMLRAGRRLRHLLAAESGGEAVSLVLRELRREALRFWRLTKRDLLRGRRTYRVAGSLMEVPADMGWAFRNGTYYERNVEYWFRRILGKLERPVVYDIGANYGYYALVAAPSACAVYAFEPVTQTYNVLKRNIERNRLLNVHPLRLAIGDEAGDTLITLYSSSGNNSAVNRSPEDVEHLEVKGRERVDVIELDSLVDQGRIPPPDLVKIDTEGSELAVLRGAREILRRSLPPFIIMEYDVVIAGDACFSLSDVRQELADLPYSLFAMHKDAAVEGVDDVQLYALDGLPQEAIGTLIAIPHHWGI